MSADNWIVCPKCIKKAEHSAAKFEKELEENYGKIPIDAFLDGKKEAQRRWDELEDYPKKLREDYEIKIVTTDKTNLHIKYSCSCNVCGFHFDLEQDYFMKI